MDEVPYEALRYNFGFEDITGSIYIPGINFLRLPASQTGPVL